MKKVWILYSGDEYETRVHGVYPSEENAKQAKDYFETIDRYDDIYTIQSREVELFIPPAYLCISFTYDNMEDGIVFMYHDLEYTTDSMTRPTIKVNGPEKVTHLFITIPYVTGEKVFTEALREYADQMMLNSGYEVLE